MQQQAQGTSFILHYSFPQNNPSGLSRPDSKVHLHEIADFPRDFDQTLNSIKLPFLLDFLEI